MQEALGEFYQDLNSVLSRHGIMEEVPLVVRPQQAVEPAPPSNGALNHTPDREMAADKSPPASNGRALLNLISSITAPAAAQSKGGHPNSRQCPGSFEYGPEQVLKTLPDIPSDSHGSLSECILRSVNNSFSELNGKGVLGGEIEQMIGVTGQLVQSFEQDDMLAPALQSPLAAIQTSLLKIVLETPEFLTEKSHPAREMLNDLGQLSTFLSGTSPLDARNIELSRAINTIIQKIGEIPQDGKEGFGAIQEELSALVEHERKQFESNVKQVLAKCQGKARHQEAKSAVASVLQEKMVSADVPLTLANLLTLGWPQLLTLTWLEAGTESQGWFKYTSVLDRLLKWLDRSQDAPPEEPSESIRLLKDMKEGFAEAPSNPVKVADLLKILTKGLLGGNAKFERLKSKRIMITSASIEKIVGVEQKKTITALKQQQLGRWLPAIRRLKQDEWIIERQNLGQKRSLKLIWRDKDDSQFVFVNGTGVQVLECNAEELAEGFQRKKYITMRDGELPLMDRSIQHILRTAFERNSEEVNVDYTTGLFSRRLFEQTLQNALESSWDDGEQHVLFTITIDQFKMINNAFGYEASNHLLKNIGSILNKHTTDNSILARLGDSVFGMLVKNCTKERGVEFADAHRVAINSYVFSWGRRKLPISTSIGMVVVDRNTTDIYSLFTDADTACFLARKSGKNKFRIYNADDQELERQRLLANSASEIDDSIKHGRLELFLQPIVPIKPETGLMSHYEVLLRVLDEHGEPGSPSDIIDAAEAYDRMQTLDCWVISTLFRWLKEHPVGMMDIGGFSLNLSGQSIGKNEMLAFIMEQLKNTSFPLDRIAFEITETATISQSEKAKEFIESIQKEGCEFYLDDFGTGLSSYEYLKNYAVDCIKIDGSFIRNIVENKADQVMVKSITDIGHFMKKRLIAEYVENEEILQLLGEIGVDYAQGWGVGKPFPLSDLITQQH
jgi:diguanylate cyclase (GGDEF)-like protein